MLYHPLADKDDQEADLISSGLDYVIVRPPRLMDGPARGNIQVRLEGALPHMEICRADVASFILDQVRDTTYVGKTPGISWSAPV